MIVAGQSRLRWRLSLLMFLLYAPPGAIVPLFSLWLQEDLKFTPREIGWACAAQSLAPLLAPLAAGQIADRWIAAERCLSLCAFAAGGLLWLMAELHSFPAICAVYLACWIFLVPVVTLGTSLCFAHLPWPEGNFGRVRLWGTIGWVASIWLLSYWFENAEWVGACLAWARPENPTSQRADMFRLAGLLSAILGIYALTLPHTPPTRKGGAWLAPLAAMKLLRGRAFAVYMAVTLGLCVTLPFAGQTTPLLLEQLEIPLPWLCRTLTIGQSMEVAALALLPMLLLRLGTRGTMQLGLAAWALALTLLMIGEPLGLVIGSLTLNGLCICCFMVAGQVFVNRQARGDIRASAQGLLTFANGIGLLAGNVLAGEVRTLAGGGFPATLAVAAAIAVCLAGVFFVGFPDDEASEEKSVE